MNCRMSEILSKPSSSYYPETQEDRALQRNGAIARPGHELIRHLSELAKVASSQGIEKAPNSMIFVRYGHQPSTAWND